MNELRSMRVAIVCDWLKDWGGAEQVLFDILEIFPNADIFSSIFFEENFPSLKGRVSTTFIDKIPFVRGKPKMVPFLRTYAFEGLDLTQYDIVISSASAESKGIITPPDVIHFCYCHTPTRYYWSHTHEYQENPEFGWLNPIAKIMMPFIFQRMRVWDYIAAQRVHYFIANSNTTARRIEHYYRRDAIAIPPGIDETVYTTSHENLSNTWESLLANLAAKKDVLHSEKLKSIQSKQYAITVCRVIPYKRIDLLIDAYNTSGETLVICTNVFSDYQKKLAEKSKENIVWIYSPSKSEKILLMQHAKVFLFPGEEDYGLTPIESMLCGTPVIAYGKGGALETVTEKVSGLFFQEQSVDSLTEAIERFNDLNWNPEVVRSAALPLSKGAFQRNLTDFIQSKIITR